MGDFPSDNDIKEHEKEENPHSDSASATNLADHENDSNAHHSQPNGAVPTATACRYQNEAWDSTTTRYATTGSWTDTDHSVTVDKSSNAYLRYKTTANCPDGESEIRVIDDTGTEITRFAVHSNDGSVTDTTHLWVGPETDSRTYRVQIRYTDGFSYTDETDIEGLRIDGTIRAGYIK